MFNLKLCNKTDLYSKHAPDIIYCRSYDVGSTRWHRWFRHYAKISQFLFLTMPLEFFIDIIFPTAPWPSGQLSL